MGETETCRRVSLGVRVFHIRSVYQTNYHKFWMRRISIEQIDNFVAHERFIVIARMGSYILIAFQFAEKINNILFIVVFSKFLLEFDLPSLIPYNFFQFLH